ncbi:MAG: NUDIX hydrolase [Thermoprotei archaeon]|nr:MAG: NUDIX hydrolase [Thermoprotei archaeon]
MTSIETLLYIIQNERVLLILKKRGLGSGLFNGVGGKVERGETIEEAVIRECIEEVRVKPLNLKWMGLLEFYNNNELYGYVHVYTANSYEGEPRETDEAKPIWFRFDEIPYDKMWGDDTFWLPHVLNGKKIYGRFWFVNWKEIIRKEVYLLNEIEI